MDKRLKFNEPWILQRADPYVYERMAGIILRHRFRHMTALYCAGQKNWQIFHRQRKWSFGKSMRVVR